MDQVTPGQYATNLGICCPACGGQQITREDLDSMMPGLATRGCTCDQCEATWSEQYTLSGYADFRPRSTMETTEYSVCVDCHLYVAHAGDEIEDGNTEHIGEAIDRELNGRQGHFSNGVAATDEDPEGMGYEEFSHHQCELCRSTLSGSRHGVTLFIPRDGEEPQQQIPFTPATGGVDG